MSLEPETLFSKVITMRKIVIASIWLLALLLPVSAAIYHVATTGDDGSDGSEAAPWQTVTHAGSKLRPGGSYDIGAFEYGASGPSKRLAKVKDFLYVLQADKISIAELAENEFDLVIIDYAKYGDAGSEYTRNEITEIKRGSAGGNRKIVLAYMSIGEAEDYRFYWDSGWKRDPPSWLGPTNPNWEGNYKVRYWMKGWKRNIFGIVSGPNKSYLDRIIDQGFDGIYLDIIDAYEYWSNSEGGNEKTRIRARKDMYKFLKELRDYARITRGKMKFLLFPQNGADIIYDDNDIIDDLGQKYLDVCNGIGQEDTWYLKKKAQPQDEYRRLTQVLDKYKANKKLVLSVDYVWAAANLKSKSNKKRFNDYYTKAYAKGYIPYAANKNQALKDIITVSRGRGFNFDQPNTNKEGRGIKWY